MNIMTLLCSVPDNSGSEDSNSEDDGDSNSEDSNTNWEEELSRLIYNQASKNYTENQSKLEPNHI